jgi:hypothetical protein
MPFDTPRYVFISPKSGGYMQQSTMDFMSSPRSDARRRLWFATKYRLAVTLTVAFISCVLASVAMGDAPGSNGSGETLTPAQAKSMTPCFYNAEMVVRIAQAKSGGLTHEAATQRVQPPNPQIQAIIDSVYAASFDNAWTYTVQDYEACATRSTDASLKLIKITEFCMQNGLISDSAASARQLGITKDKVYDRYKSFLAEPMARMAIDSVYAEDKLDGRESWRTYSWCVGQITHYPGQTATGH